MKQTLFDLSLSEILLGRMPMGIAVFDRELRAQHFNETWAEFVAQYTPSAPTPLQPGTYYFDIDPGTEDSLMPLFERVLNGETVRTEALPINSEGIMSYWDSVLSPIIEDGRVVGILDIITDATERVRTRQKLEQTLATLRTREKDFISLLENARDFVIYRVAVNPTDPYGGRVVLVSPSIRDVLGITDPYRFETWFENLHPEDLPRVIEANQHAWQEGMPYNEQARIYHPLHETWIWVHTMSQPVFDEAGNLTHFNGLILDITEQKRSQQALEEAHQTLERRVKQRTHEIERRRQAAESLRDILKLLNSDRPLDDILQTIVAQACHLAEADAGIIYHYDTDNSTSAIVAAQGMPAGFASLGPFPLTGTNPQRAVSQRQPHSVPDFDTYFADIPPPTHPMLHRWFTLVRENFEAKLTAPIFILDQPYGALELYYRAPRKFSEETVELALMIGDQAALAIENARLRVQAEQVAISNERNRIARELHDSVSQALYGIALGTRTARTLVNRQPVEESVKSALAQPLDYVLSLADAGLAEMRALIFELRPDALEKEGLVAALTKQVEALRARHKLEVATDFCEELPDLPLAAKEALYRVAQEALNNMLKHAQATNVELRLTCEPGLLHLEVKDNGVGFDPQADYPGHLGLHTMQERVTRLGGTLEIESAPGEGTTVHAWLAINLIGNL